MSRWDSTNHIAWYRLLSEYGFLCDAEQGPGLTTAQYRRAKELEYECREVNRPDLAHKLETMSTYRKQGE